MEGERAPRVQFESTKHGVAAAKRSESVTTTYRPVSIKYLLEAAPINIANAAPISSPGGKSIVL
ncbi:MAG: hypothetical protein GEU91_15860 [Rhizobiales bacterium]|nr:hypothetical protein [Hyphomicrobiales bacterium]